MKKTIVEEVLLPVDTESKDGEIISPDKDNRYEGDIILRKQPEPIKPGKKIILND